MPDLIAQGRVSRGWLGVWLSPVTERIAKQQGLSAVRGVHIDSVFGGSPADHAGLQPGDIVVMYNGQEVINSNQFMVLVSTSKGGDPVPMTVIRDGKQLNLTATIADQDAYFAAATGAGRPRLDLPEARDWLGMALVTLTKELAARLDIDYFEGVYVVGVTPGSPADRASVTEGTVILQVDDQKVKSVEDILAVADNLRRERRKIPLIVLEADGTPARKVLRP